MKQRRYYFLLIVFTSFLFGSRSLFADGIHLGVGIYNLSASVGDKKINLISPSAYSFSYTKSLLPQVSVELGYSFLFENIIGGDLSYGPQIGLRYYHFGTSTNKAISFKNISIETIRSYNPYMSIGFSQKEFQSIKSSYSGFYVGGGIEMGWERSFSIFTDFKYSSLSGPVKGRASEMTATVGIIYHDF